MLVQTWNPKGPHIRTGGGGGVPPSAPTLTALDPATAVIGGADVTLTVTGTGFTENSVILFNNSPEPTTFVSDTVVTTIVKPSTASGPWTVPVTVSNRARAISNPLDFSFAYSPPVVVTAPGQEGWTVRNQIGTGEMAFVTAPEGNISGTGGLKLKTVTSDDEVSLQHSAGFSDIAQITNLRYTTHTVSDNNNAASIVLVLDCSATGNGEGYLIYVPSKNSVVTPGTWYDRDPLASGTNNWWMPTPCTGDGTQAGATRSWDTWKTALAGVPVKAYSISLGNGEANSETFVSSFRINNATTDFEAA